VFTIEGKFIAEGILTGSQTGISTANWSKGIYMVEIHTISQTFRSRIVKQ